MLHKNGIAVDPIRLTIAHKGKTVQFRRMRSRNIMFDIACRLIFGTPATNTQLTEVVYEHCVDGGPEWAQKSVEVNTVYLARRLKEVDLFVHVERTGGNSFFDRCYVRKWVGP